MNIIPGLGPLAPVVYQERLALLRNGGTVTLVNIICPGYVKRRDSGVEEFDFPRLSDAIGQCPNVQLMIDKMFHTMRELRSEYHEGKIHMVMILADVAILNYEELKKEQDVKKTLDVFYDDIQSTYVMGTDVEFVKMSELGNAFRRIPIDGVRVSNEQYSLDGVAHDIRRRAEEYVGSLVFQRVNQAMSNATYEQEMYQSYIDQARREVARFVVEYGYAGLAISGLYENATILFTEPSGYHRGYFYHAYQEPDGRSPVLYTV